MVMAENKKIRANRLALLDEISELFSQMADFSQLAIGEEG
jgi:glycyl-tRNA synthetase beta subunit